MKEKSKYSARMREQIRMQKRKDLINRQTTTHPCRLHWIKHAWKDRIKYKDIEEKNIEGKQ
jgi:hypothetical protein